MKERQKGCPEKMEKEEGEEEEMKSYRAVTLA